MLKKCLTITRSHFHWVFPESRLCHVYLVNTANWKPGNEAARRVSSYLGPGMWGKTWKPVTRKSVSSYIWEKWLQLVVAVFAWMCCIMWVSYWILIMLNVFLWLVSHFRAVLEYDVQSFDRIVLLLEWNDFFFTFTGSLCFVYVCVCMCVSICLCMCMHAVCFVKKMFVVNCDT